VEGLRVLEGPMSHSLSAITGLEMSVNGGFCLIERVVDKSYVHCTRLDI
jgi:hypothetical protein